MIAGFILLIIFFTLINLNIKKHTLFLAIFIQLIEFIHIVLLIQYATVLYNKRLIY